MKTVVYLLGSPCAGKSTLVNEWKNSGGIVIPEFMEPVPDFVHNSWLGDEDTKLRAEEWALEQNIRKNDLINRIESKGVVLVERSPLDVLVYARAFGPRVALWTEREIGRKKWYPGKLIFLTAEFSIIKDRWIKNRGLSEYDWENQWLPLTQALQYHYEDLEKKYDIPKIDTENSLSNTMNLLLETIESTRISNIEGMVYPISGKERK